MPLGVTPDDSKRPLDGSSSPYVYRFPSSSGSSSFNGIESDQKHLPESHESTCSSNQRAQLEAELTIPTVQRLRDRLESAATKQTRLPPPPPISATAAATGGRTALRTRRGFLAKLFFWKQSKKKLFTWKAVRERANKPPLEQPLIDSSLKQSPIGDHSWLFAAPLEQHSAVADQLCDLASPDVRQARREREWTLAIVNAPAVCIDRWEHSIRLNTPHCTHMFETELERGEKRLRGMSAFIRRSRWTNSHSDSTERLTEKLSVNSPKARHSHRQHTHHQRPMSPLVERARKKTVALDRSATAPGLHLPKSSNTIPEVE